MSRTVVLEGDVPSAPCIVDPAPLSHLAPGEAFAMEAHPLTEGERSALEGAGAFTERRPAYALWYGGSFVGAATGLTHAVRALLSLGDSVTVAAVRTEGGLGGYRGVELEHPEEEPCERWERRVERGVVGPVDGPVAGVNLAVEEGAPQGGRATVTVGEPQGEALPVTLAGTDVEGSPTSATYSVVPRQHHSYGVLETLAGRTCEAVVERRDSFTHRGTRYLKVFIDTAR